MNEQNPLGGSADQAEQQQQQAQQRIRVLIVDDHPVVRVGLRTLIGAEPDMQVVADVGDGAAALEVFAGDRPDIVLLDLRLPGMSGVEVIHAMKEIDPEAKIIVLTTYDTDQDVYRAVQAGARGILLKGTFPEGILEAAIRKVQAGGEVITPEVAARSAEMLASSPLSPREVAVLELVAQGLSNKEIGTALAVTETTIKYHLKHIYPKLGAKDRTEAALLAAQRGIIKLRI
jgi:two-component system, NarL family, response regulator